MVMFTVIIPTYKTSIEMLTRAIRSVQNQSFNSWELIIVDDNPKNSIWKEQLHEYASSVEDQRIIFSFQEDNAGANAARNKGIKLAKGEYIAFLDSDDEWNALYLEKAFAAYSTLDVGITTSDVIRIFPDRTSKDKKKHMDGYIYDDLIYGDIVGTTSSVTAKKKALISAGYFDEKLPARQDYDMWLRVCKKEKIHYIREPLVYIYCDDHIRISTTSNSHISGTLMVLNKLVSKETDKDKIDKLYFSHYHHLGIWCMQNEDFNNSKKYLKLSFERHKTLNTVLLFTACCFPNLVRTLRKVYRKLKA